MKSGVAIGPILSRTAETAQEFTSATIPAASMETHLQIGLFLLPHFVNTTLKMFWMSWVVTSI